MRIALADPPFSGDRQADMASYPNIGILSLLAYLRERTSGLELHYLEAKTLHDHVEEVVSLQPDIYGISFASCMEMTSYQTINKLKSRLPEMPVICGGPHPTALPHDVMEKSAADVCVIGEGEETLCQIVNRYDGGLEDLESIPGLAFRINGHMKLSPPRSFINISDIPMPAWDMVDLDNYMGNHLYKKKPGTCILTSRGCPYDCVFCSNPVWKSSRPWLRLRTPASIAGEIEYLYQRGVRELYIRADEFNANINWCTDVCKEIAGLGHDDLFFQCNLRADKVTDQLVDALGSINCWMVHLGIESWNQRVLDGIEKFITVEQIIETCKRLKASNIKIYGFLMLYQIWEKHGELQWESAHEVDNTIRTTRKMMKSSLLDYMSWQFATPFPGSRMWDIAHRHKLVKPEIKGVWDISLNLPGITEKRMKRQRLKGFLIQSFYSLRSGQINWRFWRRIFNKVRYMIESV